MNKLQLKKIKNIILKSGLYNESFYSSQFTELPNEDLLEYYIKNGVNEDRNPSLFFDNAYYVRNNRDVYEAGVNPLYHYLTYGKKEGRLIKDPVDVDLYQQWCTNRMKDHSLQNALTSVQDFFTILKSGMFESAWYLEQNPDVAEYMTSKTAWNWRLSKNPVIRIMGRALTTPIIHYLKSGMYEGRNPAKDFSTSFYMNNNPDLINGRYLTPFVHYIQHGRFEGRPGKINTENGITFKSIFNERRQDNNSHKPLTLSVIIDGSEAVDVAYPLKEYVQNQNDIKAAIGNSTGDVIWICSRECGDDTFAKRAMQLFEDDAVFAVVRCKNEDAASFTFKSYKEFGMDKETLKGRCFGFSDIMLRNPKDYLYFKEIDTINSVEDYNLLLLNCIIGGEVAIINGESTQHYSNTPHYCKELVNLVVNRFASEQLERKNAFKAMRNLLHNYGNMSYTDFDKLVNVDSLFTDKKLKIMIGVYSFTFGGGEIMPIRLANKLFGMGYNVTVMAMLRDPMDDKVRKMLLPDIPVIYCNDKDELAFYVRELGIEVYNSHHQAIQQLFSDALDSHPDIAQGLLNVGTSHGMYENLDDGSNAYLFNETNLMKNTDCWTYVADKNTAPFENFGVYNKDRFYKVPNGMEKPVISKISLSEYGINEKSFVVTIISRALKEKGWLHAINAVTAVKQKTNMDIHLLLIGEGVVYDEYADSLGNEFIHFLGFRDVPCDYFAVSDLCILPSYYVSESAPLCLIEAMMCGIPSVASNIGDIKYMLECDGELAGSVFDLENGAVNDAVLADRILQMVTDKSLYEQAAATAKKKREYYLIDNIAKMYLTVYDNFYSKTNTAKNVSGEELIKLKKSTEMLALAEQGKDVPKVSVIVPNYNHSKFLKKRLDCIYNQSYTNFEVILMDDCSTDNSREILKQYAEKYPDITKLAFNEQNSGGVFYQWAKGIKLATGQLCWIAESDDYCEETLLEELVPYFEDENVKLAYAKYCFVDENDNKNEAGFFNYVGYVDKQKWHGNYVNDAENEVDTALGVINTIPNASGAIFKHPGNNDVFDDADWYRMKICGDWVFYLHILKGGKVAYSVDTTSYFRFHSNNSSAKTYTNSNYYTEHEKVASTLRNLFYVDREVIEKNHSKIRDFYYEHIDGSDKEFNSWYSVDRAMKWYPSLKKSDEKIAAQKKKYNLQYKTIVIDPIISATDSDEVEFNKKMEFVGNNTGNMLFVEAVKEQTEHIDELWFNGAKLAAQASKQPVSAIIPSSNFIIAGSDNMVDSMRRMYEATDCPITMVGLGAQAYAPYNTPRKLVERLTENKISFFKMAAERAVSLGVRGEFTAECLEIMGIKNYRIIGCPTCYKYFDGVYKPLPQPSADKLLFTVTGKNANESNILRFGMKNNATLLMQMTTELPQVLYNQEISDEMLEKSFPQLGISAEKYTEFIKSNGKIFFNMDKWNDYLKNGGFTFSFGSRFHGNMSALRNGIPALWITHDSRTSELIQTLKLPHITLSEFNEIKNVNKLIEHCDYTEFYKAYEQLTGEYVAFLEENGIEHKFNLS